MLAQIATSVNVDLLPGETDPTNNSLPQQPFSRVLLPKASRLTTFRSTPNPYEAEIQGKL
jgi:DNA polymerase delta subunit 2